MRLGKQPLSFMMADEIQQSIASYDAGNEGEKKISASQLDSGIRRELNEFYSLYKVLKKN